MAVLYGISDIGANKSDPTEVTNPKVYCSGRSTSYHKLADTSNVVINSKPRSGLTRNIPPLGGEFTTTITLEYEDTPNTLSE